MMSKFTCVWNIMVYWWYNDTDLRVLTTLYCLHFNGTAFATTRQPRLQFVRCYLCWMNKWVHSIKPVKLVLSTRPREQVELHLKCSYLARVNYIEKYCQEGLKDIAQDKLGVILKFCCMSDITTNVQCTLVQRTCTTQWAEIQLANTSHNVVHVFGYVIYSWIGLLCSL